MQITRRSLFKIMGAAGGLSAIGSRAAAAENTSDDDYGCLADVGRCIGCRKCEMACSKVNALPPAQTSFEDMTVFDRNRRPDEAAFTVVNRYFSSRADERGQPVPAYIKVQCMHCLHPACASACITGALKKQENGAVTYNPSRCIGCRYCMIACPFQIPAYEFSDPLTPRVRKCTFCFENISKQGGLPGCAAICPVEALTFGTRSELLKIAHQRISEAPLEYVQKVYGEHEVGGTSWLYISKVPFEKLGLYPLPEKEIPHLTETIQHSIFAYMWAPITLFGILAGAMRFFNPQQMSGKPSQIQTEKEV